MKFSHMLRWYFTRSNAGERAICALFGGALILSAAYLFPQSNAGRAVRSLDAASTSRAEALAPPPVRPLPVRDPLPHPRLETLAVDSRLDPVARLRHRHRLKMMEWYRLGQP